MAKNYKFANVDNQANDDFDYESYDKKTAELITKSEDDLHNMRIKNLVLQEDLKAAKNAYKDMLESHFELIRDRKNKRGQPQQQELYDGGDDDENDNDDEEIND